MTETPDRVLGQNVLRVATYILRVILSFMMAIPTAAAVYQIANPRSILNDIWKYNLTLTDWLVVELNRTFAPWGMPELPTIGVQSTTGWFDWGEFLIFAFIAFLAYMGIYSVRRRLPLMILLTIPTFEGLRYWRAPYAEELALQYLRLLCLQPIWLALILIWGVVWFLMRRYTRTAQNWRQTATITIITISVVAIAARFTPLSLAFSPRTTAYPGTVWLAALIALWFALMWLSSKVWVRSTTSPQEQIAAKQRRRLGVE